MDNFKARKNLSFKFLSGEKNSADYESAEEFKLLFNGLVNDYKPEDIFNPDENALYTKFLPLKSILMDGESAGNFKPCLGRVTVALIYNNVCEKLKPVIIGKSANPRCLKNIDRVKLGVDYFSPSKGWMTTGIFHK